MNCWGRDIYLSDFFFICCNETSSWKVINRRNSLFGLELQVSFKSWWQELEAIGHIAYILIPESNQLCSAHIVLFNIAMDFFHPQYADFLPNQSNKDKPTGMPRDLSSRCFYLCSSWLWRVAVTISNFFISVFSFFPRP